MKRSVIFGVVSLAIVGLLGFVGGRVSNKEVSKANNKTTSSYSNEGSDEDICFELSEEDLANLKNGLGLTVNGQNVDITGFDEKFREEEKAAGFE